MNVVNSIINSLAYLQLLNTQGRAYDSTLPSQIDYITSAEPRLDLTRLAAFPCNTRPGYQKHIVLRL